MPTVKLKRPATYTVFGITLHKGVVTPVPPHVAEYLLDNDPHERFVVRMDDNGPASRVVHVQNQVHRDDNEVKLGEKVPRDPMAVRLEAMQALRSMKIEDAICEATGLLSEDVETNFDFDGRPAVAALGAVIGRPITEEERDAALGLPARVKPEPEAAPQPLLDTAAEKPRPRIIRRVKAPVVEPPQEDQPDASTEDAVTV